MNRGNQSARAANCMGLICGSRNQKREQTKWFEKAMHLEPNNAVFKGNYGFALADEDRGNEAEAIMRASLALDPNLRYLYTRLGDLYRERGDETAAQREFAQAVRLIERETGEYPDSSSTWRSAESLYRRVGDYEKAADAQRRATLIERNERLGGDHSTMIAGPDSGFLSAE
jgi:tetratricopeptide (TPR) repeat protein